MQLVILVRECLNLITWILEMWVTSYLESGSLWGFCSLCMLRSNYIKFSISCFLLISVCGLCGPFFTSGIWVVVCCDRNTEINFGERRDVIPHFQVKGEKFCFSHTLHWWKSKSCHLPPYGSRYFCHCCLVIKLKEVVVEGWK